MTHSAKHRPVHRPPRRRPGTFGKCVSILDRVVLILLSLGPTARAALPTAWPDPNTVTGIRPIEVALTSSDPFTPADAGLAKSRVVRGQLYLPPEASPARRVPALVLLHGSVGNARERGHRYGLPLAALGVAVLVVETYASREDLGRSFVGRALHITETMFDADAYAGLDLLSHRPDIDAAHIGLIGFSYGGMAATYAMQRLLAERLARPGERFAAVASYYAPCIARFDDVRTTGAPLLMMYGGKDQLIHPDRGAAVAGDLRRGGREVTIVEFPNAVHQWDGEMAPRLIGRHLADCDFRVDAHGIVHDRNTGMMMTGPLTRGIILALCTGSRQWPIGRDDLVAAQSNATLSRFLRAAGFAR